MKVGGGAVGVAEQRYSGLSPAALDTLVLALMPELDRRDTSAGVDSKFESSFIISSHSG